MQPHCPSFCFKHNKIRVEISLESKRAGFSQGACRLSMKCSVQVQEEADVTAGGVLLPLTAKEKPIAGSVVRAGPGKFKEDGTRSIPKVRCNAVWRACHPPSATC